MPRDISNLGMLGATMAGNAVLGMWNDGRQQKANELNTKRQLEANKEMSNFQYRQEMRKWEETGYSAQMKQLKEAGLNPALMYGMGGGGGQSSNVGSAGGVAGGAAPSSGGEMHAAMGLALMKAQKENIEALTEKTKQEAKYTGGAQTANTESGTALNLAQVQNTAAKTKLTEIETRTAGVEAQVAEETMYEAIGQIRYNMQRTQEEVNQLLVQNHINRATKDEVIKSFRLQNAETIANIGLKQAQRSNTFQMTEESKAKVVQWMKENAMRAQEIQIQGRRVTVDELEQGVDRSFKEALIEQGQWHNFIQGMQGVMNLGLPSDGGRGVQGAKPF